MGMLQNFAYCRIGWDLTSKLCCRNGWIGLLTSTLLQFMTCIKRKTLVSPATSLDIILRWFPISSQNCIPNPTQMHSMDLVPNEGLGTRWNINTFPVLLEINGIMMNLDWNISHKKQEISILTIKKQSKVNPSSTSHKESLGRKDKTENKGTKKKTK